MPITSPKMPAQPEGSGFKLVGFPKEFERNFWDSLDKRFFSILIVTWIIIYGFFLIMASRGWELSEEQLQKIREKAITQVYGAQIITEVQPKAEEEPNILAPAESPEEKISEEGKKLVEESSTERVQRRQRSRTSRAEQVRKMEQEVSGSGILAIATAAGGGGDGGYADVLKGLSSGAGGIADVGKLVSGTVGIGVAGRTGERTRLAKGGGYRGSGAGLGIDDLISGQGASRSSSFSRRGSVKIQENVEISGAAAGQNSRDQNNILTVINKNRASVEYCYQKQLKINPNLHGDIYLEIEIMPNGRVSNVRVLSSSLGDKNLERCIKRAVGRWRGFGKIDPSLGSVRTRFKYIL